MKTADNIQLIAKGIQNDTTPGSGQTPTETEDILYVTTGMPAFDHSGDIMTPDRNV